MARGAQSWISRRAVLTAGAVAVFAGRARAQSGYPSKAVKIVVPFPPGNAGDVTARLISDRLGERLGASIYVENRAGAAGVLGVNAVVNAEPDGHTLLVTSLSPLVINPPLLKTAPYDVARDLAPVALIGWTSMMLIANNDFPASNVADAVKLIKSQPGKFSYAQIGTGTLSQLSMRLFIRAADLDMVEVPYRGSGQALTDIMSGRVPLMFDGMTSSNPQVVAGSVKALAVSSASRSVFAPNVPTLKESGLSVLEGYEVLGWTALLAPVKTPKAIIERLNREIMAIVMEPGMKERFMAQFLEPFPPSTPQQFGNFIQAETAKWDAAAADAGIKGTQ